MFGGWLELVYAALALFFSGVAIKLMDDALDIEYDLCRGKRTLAARLGRACLPYSLASFGIGMALDSHVALAAFLGSYAVGMFGRLEEHLPSHVPAYVEIVIAMLLAVLLLGWRDALFGFAMMCMIDWLDDVMDRHNDKMTGQFNVVVRFGLVEVLFAILIAFCLALYAQAVWTILALVILAVLNIVFDVLTTTVMVPDDEGVGETWS